MLCECYTGPTAAHVWGAEPGGKRRRRTGVPCMLSFFSRLWLFATLWTVACQAPLSVGFCRQEYWSGLPCPPLGNLPDSGIEPSFPEASALQADSLPLSYQGKPRIGPAVKQQSTDSGTQKEVSEAWQKTQTMLQKQANLFQTGSVPSPLSLTCNVWPVPFLEREFTILEGHEPLQTARWEQWPVLSWGELFPKLWLVSNSFGVSLLWMLTSFQRGISALLICYMN